LRRRQLLAAAAVATIPGFFARAFAAEGEDALRSVLAAPGRRPVLVVSLRLELAGTRRGR
jgi:hypothetical protein